MTRAGNGANQETNATESSTLYSSATSARMTKLRDKTTFHSPRLCLFVALALMSGCRESGSASNPTADSASTPAEKFARFEAQLRRLCQEASGSLVTEDASGLGTTSVRTIIETPSSLLHPPATQTGNYTAEVTIVSRLIYASSNPTPTENDTPSRLRAPGEKQPVSKEEEREALAQANAGSPLRRLGRQEEFRDTYDFVYRDDRWELVSRDPPESMRLLIDRALELQ